MKQYEVTMICREIWRAKVVVNAGDNDDLETVKDEAWSMFDANKSLILEQENFTKVEAKQKEEE